MDNDFRDKIENLFNSKDSQNIDLAFELMKGQNCSVANIAQIWSYSNYMIFETTKYNPFPKLAYFIPSKKLLALNYIEWQQEPNFNEDRLTMAVIQYDITELYDLNKSSKPFKIYQQKSSHNRFLRKSLGVLIKKYFLPFKIPIV